MKMMMFFGSYNVVVFTDRTRRTMPWRMTCSPERLEQRLDLCKAACVGCNTRLDPEATLVAILRAKCTSGNIKYGSLVKSI